MNTFSKYAPKFIFPILMMAALMLGACGEEPFDNWSHTMGVDDAQMLQSGEQTLHVKLHLDENENKVLDMDEPVLSFRDVAYEASIEVTVQ